MAMISLQKRAHYLSAMGVDVYSLKSDTIVATLPSVSELEQNLFAEVDASLSKEEIWQSLRQRVAICQQCDLHRGRTQTVFGIGNVNADWLVIGEAPGAEEDKQGEPFVGPAGKLLNNMLLAIGLQRAQIFIANILKCRPPNNRDPKPQEIDLCMSYLSQQIDLIRPKIILALGRVAAQSLIHTDSPINKMRGKHYQYADQGIPIVVTYHPAYLLRAPLAKKKVWQDMQFAMHIYQAET